MAWVPDEFDRAVPVVVADVRRSYPQLARVEALDHVRRTVDVDRLGRELRALEGRLNPTELEVRDRELLRAYDTVCRVLAWGPTHAELTELVRALASPDYVELTPLQEWWVYRAARATTRDEDRRPTTEERNR